MWERLQLSATTIAYPFCVCVQKAVNIYVHQMTVGVTNDENIIWKLILVIIIKFE